jgi:SAM-dependent methyltransferase
MMSFVNDVKARLANKIRAMVQSEVDKRVAEILPQLLEFHNSPQEMRQSFHDHTKDPANSHDTYIAMRNQLDQLGVKVEDASIDVSDFRKWLNSYPEINAAYRGSEDVYIEKCLEHYLSFTYLDLSPNDTFIDIAAAESPFYELLHRRIGLTSYCLDLSYPKGIHNRNIGADAGDTGLNEGFATAMALHCAYECFMGDADIRFVREAARILRPGGRYVIVPLYIDNTYFIATSPYCNQDDIIFDSGSLKVWRDDPYRVPFSRHYSPQSFAQRIYSRIPSDMAGMVYFMENLPDVWKSFSGQRVYCYFLFMCIKLKS